MAKNLIYPFVPKSNAYLRPGHFWQIPLSNGWFACGRVLQIDHNLRYGSRTTILAGLIDWSGDSLPTSIAIAGCKLLEQGEVHIKSISWNNGQILGYRPLEEDGIEPMNALSHTLMYSSWGLQFIKVLAEKYFIEKRKSERKSL